MDMKQKYKKSFRHELAQGVIGKDSLVACMQAKFDNDKRALKRRSQMEVEAPSNCKAAYGCVRWRVTTLPVGEYCLSDTFIKRAYFLVNIFTYYFVKFLSVYYVC